MPLQYLPITEAQTDDVVQFCKPSPSHGFIDTHLYVTREPYIANGYRTHSAGPGHIKIKFDADRDPNGWAEGYFKLVRTKPGNQAKVGDVCIMIQDHPNRDYGPKCNTVFKVTEIRGTLIISDIPAPIGHPTWALPTHLFKVLVQHHQRISKTKPLKEY